MRIAIFPYGISSSVNLLKDAINETFAGNNNPARKLRTVGSVFQGREEDLLINWGSSSLPEGDFTRFKGEGLGLNSPLSIRTASMKTEALAAMADAGVSVVPYTQSPEVAQTWLDEGKALFERTLLQGHSGAGIRYLQDVEEVEDLGNVVHARQVAAPFSTLYTQAISGPRREYRIHVVQGKVIYVQLKRRRSGYREDENYSNIVRNHGTGWIYANNNVTPNDAALLNAVKAVESCNLDFGAVDVITNQEDAWVLEINTAPGLTGETTLGAYVSAFLAIANREEVSHNLPEGMAFPVEVARPAPVEPVPTEGVAADEGYFLEVPFEATVVPVGVPSGSASANAAAITSAISQSRTRGAAAPTSSRPTRTNQAPARASIIPQQVTMPSFAGTDYEGVVVVGTPLHTTVSAILGSFAAEYELSRVIVSGGRCELNHSSINSAMTWRTTPQGQGFWIALHEGTSIPSDYRLPQEAPVVAEPVTAPVAPATATVAPAGDVDSAPSVVTLIDGTYYQLQLDEMVTIGQYCESIGEFFVIGFDVPVSPEDVAVMSVISL